MIQIPIEAVTPERLKSLQESVEFVDDDGRILGCYTPVLRPPYDSELLESFDREGFERARLSGPGITTQELLEKLEK
jgi:hypothetical protein